MSLIFYQSDSRYVELASLEEVEKDLATQYGRLFGSYIDSVDVFQVVKDRAFNIKDEKSLSDLQKLDRLLKLRLELKTGASVSVHFLRSSIALFTKSPSPHIAFTSRGFGCFFAISVRAAAFNASSITRPSFPSRYFTPTQASTT